jgi:DNA ligase-1
MYLDGELWIDYDSVEELQKILSAKTITDEKWRKIQFVVFDSPDHSVREKPYLERLQHIRAAVDELKQPHAEIPNPQTPQSPQKLFVRVVEAEECKGMLHFQNVLLDILERGGEGVVVHHPTASYVPGYPMWHKKVLVVMLLFFFSSHV